MKCRGDVEGNWLAGPTQSLRGSGQESPGTPEGEEEALGGGHKIYDLNRDNLGKATINNYVGTTNTTWTGLGRKILGLVKVSDPRTFRSPPTSLTASDSSLFQNQDIRGLFLEKLSWRLHTGGPKHNGGWVWGAEEKHRMRGSLHSKLCKHHLPAHSWLPPKRGYKRIIVQKRDPQGLMFGDPRR